MAKTFEAIQKSKEMSTTENNFTPYLNKWETRNFKQKQSLSDILGKIGMLDNASKNKIFHFASATNGEGTSTILVNLARFMADIRFQKNVLVIDGNFESPVMHSAFNLPLAPGFCEVIRKEAKLSEAIHQLAESQIYIMPCGQPSKHRFGIDPNLISTLISEAQKEYAFIIFDSPPVLTSSIARLWASFSDMSFLVIQANRTQWEVAQKAQALLEKQGTTIGGAILNRVQYSIPKNVYNRV